jgi:predicted HAD superfamily Cof-like phosphohydrolase
MEFQTTKFDVVQTGIYKDVYQLKLGYYKKDTTEFKVKSYPKTIDGQEKYFPISVPIGEKYTAADFLLEVIVEILDGETEDYLLKFLEKYTGKEYVEINNASAPEQPPIDEIPF